jgi:hypothetical protein
VAKNYNSTDTKMMQPLGRPVHDAKPAASSDAICANVRLRRESAGLRKECQRFFGERSRIRPDQGMVTALLTEAERNVAACDKIVERQRAIIEKHESAGHDASEARAALHALLNTQALNVLTRDRLLGILSE